jgi:hypothetical protein
MCGDDSLGSDGSACEEAKRGLSLNIEKIVHFRIH